MRSTRALFWAYGLTAAVALLLGTGFVLLPFGHGYSEHEVTAVLRLLLFASVFHTVIALFSAVARAKNQGSLIALIELALLVLVLGPAVPLAHYEGIGGVAFAWLAANVMLCLAVFPLLLRFLRGSGTT